MVVKIGLGLRALRDHRNVSPRQYKMFANVTFSPGQPPARVVARLPTYLGWPQLPIIAFPWERCPWVKDTSVSYYATVLFPVQFCSLRYSSCFRWMSADLVGKGIGCRYRHSSDWMKAWFWSHIYRNLVVCRCAKWRPAVELRYSFILPCLGLSFHQDR